MLLRESMGVSADSSSRAFPSSDVEAFFKRPRLPVPEDVWGGSSEEAQNHIIVAVDPAGGGSSQFAVFSLVQVHTGQVIVSRAPSNAFLRRRKISQSFALPHLREHHGKQHKAVGALAAIFDKQGYYER